MVRLCKNQTNVIGRVSSNDHYANHFGLIICLTTLTPYIKCSRYDVIK